MTGVLGPTFSITPGLHFLFDVIVEDDPYFIIISNQEKAFSLHLQVKVKALTDRCAFLGSKRIH